MARQGSVGFILCFRWVGKGIDGSCQEALGWLLRRKCFALPIWLYTLFRIFMKARARPRSERGVWL